MIWPSSCDRDGGLFIHEWPVARVIILTVLGIRESRVGKNLGCCLCPGGERDVMVSPIKIVVSRFSFWVWLFISLFRPAVISLSLVEVVEAARERLTGD